MKSISVVCALLCAGIASASRGSDTIVAALTGAEDPLVLPHDIDRTVDAVTTYLGPTFQCPSDSESYVFLTLNGVDPVPEINSKTAPTIAEFMRDASSVLQVDQLAQSKGVSLAQLFPQHCKVKVTQFDASDIVPSTHTNDANAVLAISDTNLQSLDQAFKAILTKIPSSSSVRLYFHGVGCSDAVANNEHRNDDSNDEEWENPFDDSSLFAKYQFFGSGVFMTMIVGLVGIAALLVGMSWLLSLQVSYRAFEAPSGPDQQSSRDGN